MKLAAGDFGIGIGDVPRPDGLRLNFRDRYLERVGGINSTLRFAARCKTLSEDHP